MKHIFAIAIYSLIGLNVILNPCQCGRNKRPVRKELTSVSMNCIKFYGKPIQMLIDSLGEPDYQTGCMEYIDPTRVSRFWSVFDGKYEGKTVPIKAYAWKLGKEYLICYCTYYDDRVIHMPQYLIYQNGHFPLQEWLTYYSGNDGFMLAQSRSSNTLDSHSVSYSESVEWVSYFPETSTTFKDFYYSRLIVPLLRTSLSSVAGTSRDTIINRIGEPFRSEELSRDNLPDTLKNNSWMVHEMLSDRIIVDRYRYFDSFANNGGVVYLYFNIFGDNNSLAYSFVEPDVDYYIEY